MYPNVEQQFGQAHTMNSSGQVRAGNCANTVRQRKPGRGREANLIDATPVDRGGTLYFLESFTRVESSFA
jgi:hypothetical protein